MHSCVYTLGLCVHSYRDAHHKQTFASMSFQKNKGIFPSLYREGLHWRRARTTSSLLSSISLIPEVLWDPNSSVPLPKGLHSAQLCWPPPSWGRWRSRTGSCSSESFSLQCNSLATQRFPTEGPPNVDNFTLLLPCL